MGLVIALSVAAACARTEGSEADGRLRIVASVSPITNLVENIAGDRIDLVGAVPEGVNSHTFEPAPSDARLLAEAEVVFVNGLNLEVPLLELARANLKEGGRIVELGGRTISPEEWIFDFSFPREGGDPNPHLWTNPPYALRFAEVIRDVLSDADPPNRAIYDENLRRVAGRMQALDRAIRRATETVPAERRKLLTYHDSFPYFAREYGWTVIGAIQPSDFSEPTPREVGALIDQVRAEGVPAIFGSEVFPSPVLAQIAREAGATYVDDLRDDDLPGDPGEPEHSYFGLIKFNLIVIVESLGGDAAPIRTVGSANVTSGNARYR